MTVPFTSEVLQFSKKVETYKDAIQNESQTRTVLVEPLLQLLGYDVRNPFEVIHEFTCDVGTKRGEKVDYALDIDDSTTTPDVLIEVKSTTTTLSSRSIAQLYRYYAAATVHLAVLTNGLEYWFFSDTERENIMDETPFYKIAIEHLTDDDIDFLKALTKEQYGNVRIKKLAREHSHKTQDELKQSFRNYMMAQATNPSKEFTNFVVKQLLAMTTKAKQELVEAEIQNLLQTSTYLMTGIEPVKAAIVHVQGDYALSDIPIGDNVVYETPTHLKLYDTSYPCTNYRDNFTSAWANLLHDYCCAIIKSKGVGFVRDTVQQSGLKHWLAQNDDNMTEPIAVKAMYGSIYVDASLPPHELLRNMTTLTEQLEITSNQLTITFG